MVFYVAVVGYTSTAVMNTISILIVDLFPGQGSTITGCVRLPRPISIFPFLFCVFTLPTNSKLQNNLVRCGLGAALVSVIDLILEALDPGWTYVVMAAMCLAVSPLLFIEIRFGPRWREQRRRRASVRA